MDNILVMLFHLDDYTGFVPFEGMGSSLVLDVYVVTHSEWWKASGVFCPSFC